jgi:hypothetical protein
MVRFASDGVTAGEIPDIDDVNIKTFMNGQMTQNNSTRNLINSFGRIISPRLRSTQRRSERWRDCVLRELNTK